MSPVAAPSQQSVVCYGARDMRVEDRFVWPPQPQEAQVRVVATGLCGSDCEYYLHNVIQSLHLCFALAYYEFHIPIVSVLTLLLSSSTLLPPRPER